MAHGQGTLEAQQVPGANRFFAGQHTQENLRRRHELQLARANNPIPPARQTGVSAALNERLKGGFGTGGGGDSVPPVGSQSGGGGGAVPLQTARRADVPLAVNAPPQRRRNTRGTSNLAGFLNRRG
jgi:hypothetical protein